MCDTDVWIELPERPGYRCKIIQQDNITIRVFRPILSDVERQRRGKQIMSSVGRILAKYDFEDDV